MKYAINYDLHQPGRDYEKLYEAIKGLGEWWHYLGSTWLVSTNLTASQIWARLQPHSDSNDNFLVIGLTDDFSGWLPEKAWNWIRNH